MRSVRLGRGFEGGSKFLEFTYRTLKENLAIQSGLEGSDEVEGKIRNLAFVSLFYFSLPFQSFQF